MKNYVMYHLHSDLSNAVTNIDSVTKYKSYIDRAKECGMQALAFSEHGSVMEWWHKKCDIEAAGMKYIHACEVYVTATLEEKVRDNMHCVLIAKNKDGVFEMNRAISKSFNRTDNHFYYMPRISKEELFGLSENIIITSACIGGILAKTDGELHDEFVQFFAKNKNRCFFEIGHHHDETQVKHNRYLNLLSQQYDVPLIAGTDTHALNDEHVLGRHVLQWSKQIHFDNEDRFDLRFKTYDELVEAYQTQEALPDTVFLTAIDNTNRLLDMVEDFSIDKGTKYPHIYENPEATFRQKIEAAVDKHPYLNQRYDKEELWKTLDEEIDVYKQCKAIDFMLMQTYLREWEHAHNIWCGPGRGSVSGSLVAYALGVTNMDSKRFGLNFFRFMNPSRVSNCDIDTDYGGADRDRMKEFLLKEHMDLPQIQTSEIITFNTIALKGAIHDVCRGLYRDDEKTGTHLGRADYGMDYKELISTICKDVETKEEEMRKRFPEVFEYVDIINGTIVSVGTHPSGVLVSDLDIASTIGLCSTAQSPYPVSMLNMKELDDLFYVKLDILGLDNISVINQACQLAGIERLTPDNTDLEDMNVWKSIRDDTTGIFQWSSNSAQQYIRKFMSDSTLKIARERIPNFSMLKWMSFGNGLLRPACASYRDEVADGIFADNGIKELNDFLAPEAGHVCMQETIMQFLVKFCGYSQAESDTVRRMIAKKKGTETAIPEIERRFIEYTSANYNIPVEKCAEVIKPFLQVILDASSYGFSWNHSDAYSAIGYICGYLRYYYPYEFCTAALNAFRDDEAQVDALTDYARQHGIQISPARYGVSRGQYHFDKEKHVIAKGLESVKYLNTAAAEELYRIAHEDKPATFMALLKAVSASSAVNSRQLDTLIDIDFFQDFGNSRELKRMVELFEFLKRGAAKTIRKEKLEEQPLLQQFVPKFITERVSKTRKPGEEAKVYVLSDIDGLLDAIEAAVREQHIPELPFRVRASIQQEILGYVDIVTGQEIDRRKLYILDCYTLVSKRTNKPWLYKIRTRSIGSGKQALLSVRPFEYERVPIRKGDIIYAHNVAKDAKGYWNLLSWKQLNDI